MIASLVFWTALLSALAGLAMLIPRRTRRVARFVLIAAVAAIVITLAWPALLERSSGDGSHLDSVMPRFQFSERHVIHVDAPPERVYAAIRAVTAGDIQWFRTLTAIRRLGRPLPAGILNAPAEEPILDLATRTSFRWLANDPPRELVIGVRVARDTNAAMNFLVAADGHGGSNLSTETRVYAATDAAVRAFKVYWRIIRPGSEIIRRSWLRAIKRRAEQA